MTQEEWNTKRTRTEVFSRIVGYLRPTSTWHEGKLAERSIKVDYNKQLQDHDSSRT